MMANTKKVFKCFSITEYRKEEEYLSSMHRDGWKFTKVIFPGIYYFEKCEPENVTYRLDYNQEGIANKAEYVQMFADCGWEYMFDFFGYSYFRKTGEAIQEDSEIFCDDESRFDMMKRVYRGRIIPLIIIFFCIIIPQYLTNSHGYGGGGIVQEVLSVALFALGLLYLLLFSVFTIDFCRYEHIVYPQKEHLRLKYAGIYTAIIVCALILGGNMYLKLSSDYELQEKKDGFVVEAERLNKTVEKEYELKKGDTIQVNHNAAGGSWYVEIGREAHDPVFYGNTFEEFEDFTVEIQEDGAYQIVCKGRNAKGSIAFEIKKS